MDEVFGELLKIIKNQQNTINTLNDKINILDKNNSEQRNEFINLIKLVNNAEKSLDHVSTCINSKRVNKEKTNYEMKTTLRNGFSGVFGGRTPKLIVSLTSFPERMYDIKYALFSLLTQSLKPDMIILWLAEEQFPNREDDISDDILDLKNYGLTIKWCRDIKSYKKLIPALKEFPDDIIITVDDDIYYEKDMLERLYTEYLKNPNTTVCSMGTEITFCGSNIAPNKKWKNTGEKSLSPLNVCLSGSGMLHPPFSSGIVCKDILNEELFMKLCPTSDDLWIWAMYAVNRGKYICLIFSSIICCES